MKTIEKFVTAGVAGILALGMSTAFANDRPEICSVNHDHRSHNADYYDYYGQDRYSRAGAYRDSGLRVSLRFGDDDYSRDRRYDNRDRGYDNRGRGYDNRGRRYDNRGRIVHREVYDTRYRARIVLKEEVRRSRRGHRVLVCTVSARGPDAHHVSERRMRRIANRECSRRAHIRVRA